MTADFAKWTRDEVEMWPGVTVEFEVGAKHPRAVLAFGEASRFVVYASTSSDRRAIYAHVATIRHELAEMGATRAERAKANGTRRERNPGADMRELPIGERAAVMPDPWEALREFAERPLITTAGAYPNMGAEAYHRDPRLLPAPSLSSSGAKTIIGRSPYHFWFDSPLNPDRPEEKEKAHYSVGKAAHDVILLTDRWPNFYYVLPDGYNPVATKAQKEWHAEAAEARDAGKVILKFDEAETVRSVAAALQRHELAMALLTNGVTEETLVWQDPTTGVWLRARPDFRPNTILEKRSVMAVADLKFVAPTHADPRGFSRAIDNFGYYQSAAFYADGIKAVYGHYPTNWVHVVVEKEPPYSVAIYELPGEDIERGRWLNRRAINTFAKCLESGVWPGFGDPKPDGSVIQVGLPHYARMRIEQMADDEGDHGAWSAAAE